MINVNSKAPHYNSSDLATHISGNWPGCVSADGQQEIRGQEHRDQEFTEQEPTNQESTVQELSDQTE